jgi:hypothetical protein
VGVTADWWWPDKTGKGFWPSDVPRELTVDAFRMAFATLGYEVCSTAELEPGFEKIALFARDLEIPTHAARQLTTGRWASKLGMMEDIEHDLRDIGGAVYGSVILVMKRRQSVGNVTRPSL